MEGRERERAREGRAPGEGDARGHALCQPLTRCATRRPSTVVSEPAAVFAVALEEIDPTDLASAASMPPWDASGTPIWRRPYSTQCPPNTT